MQVDGGQMSVSFLGLFALAGLATVVFLAVLGLITLLTNPKTRDVAKILLGGMAAFAILVGLVGALFFGVRQQRVVVREEAYHTRALQLEQKAKRVQQIEAGVDSTSSSHAAAVELPPDPRGRDTIKPSDALDALAESESSDEDVVTKSEASTPETAAEQKEISAVPEKPEEASQETDNAATAEEPQEAVAPKKSELVATPEEPETAAVAVEAEKSDVGQLSVAPLARDNRPEWVDREPYKEGSVYCWPVVSDPRSDADQAEQEALPEALNAAVADYIASKLRLGSVASRQVHLAPDYVLDQLVGDDIWLENRSLKVGEFVRAHALVKFDREANSIIREAWENQRLVSRLWSAGGFLAMALFVLALVYCYLKIDQVTHGAGRRLLRIAAILVILGLMLVAAGVASIGIA